MLKKLLKYELSYIYKFIIVFYSLALFFGVLTRIFLNIPNSFILNIVGQICSGITISMMVSILINNLMRLWARFKNNLYGDESYLIHTLPVEKKTLYLSKILTAVISLFTSVIVISLTLFIAYYSKENSEILKSTLLPIASFYESTVLKLVLVFLFVFFLEFANALQSGYTGIILGHKMNNAKMGFSILFGFINYIIIQIVLIFMIFLVALFNNNIMNLFVSNEIGDINIIKALLLLASIIYMLALIINYIINLKLFKNGVNVD